MMLKYTGNTVQQRFISSLKFIKGRFKNKIICEQTGYSKAIVSSYVNQVQEPSEKFLRTYCEKFGFDFVAIWDGEQSKGVEEPGATYTIKIEDRLMRLVESQQSTIYSQQQTILTLVDRMGNAPAQTKAS